MRLGFDPWVGKIPWRRAWQLTPVFLLGESHGEEPGGLQSIVSQRVGHNWSDSIYTIIFIIKLLEYFEVLIAFLFLLCVFLFFFHFQLASQFRHIEMIHLLPPSSFETRQKVENGSKSFSSFFQDLKRIQWFCEGDICFLLKIEKVSWLKIKREEDCHK